VAIGFCAVSGKTIKPGRGLLALVAALSLWALVPAAHAGVITPTITTDEDSVLNGGDTGCSLREAITAADVTGSYGGCVIPGGDSGPDTVRLVSGQTYTLGGTNLNGVDDANAFGDLDVVDEDLTIDTTGVGTATIDGNGATTGDRVLHVGPSVADGVGSFQLTNIAVTDGVGTGAGLLLGSFAASSVIANSRIFGTHAGGAILQEPGVTGTTIASSYIHDNHAGATGAGGGLRLDGNITNIDNTTIESNTAGGAGGVFAEAGMVFINGSTVNDNHGDDATNGLGGGLGVTGAQVTVTNSTIDGNTADRDGGGVYASTGATVNLNNTTVSENTADNDTGGPGDIPGLGGGLYADGGGVTVTNTILSDNIDTSAAILANDCSGAITVSYTLIEDGVGCTPTGSNNLIGMGAAIGPLTNNGGATETRELLPGSPAINAGDPGTMMTPTTCDVVDQRMLPRTGVVAPCDMGAFEVQPSAPPGGGGTPPTQTASTPVAAAAPPAKKKCKKGRKLKRGKCVKKKR
jgi:CSLREA domain-containing protein